MRHIIGRQFGFAIPNTVCFKEDIALKKIISSEGLLISQAHYLQIAERKLLPLLKKKMDDPKPKLTIENGQLCVNGVPIGDWTLISNYRLADQGVSFQYGEKRTRYLFFGSETGAKTRIVLIHEAHRDQLGVRCIYQERA